MLITQKGRQEYTSSKAARRIVVESNADLWYKTRPEGGGSSTKLRKPSQKNRLSGGLGESKQKLEQKQKNKHMHRHRTWVP